MTTPKTRPHVMCDLETMGTGDHAVIIQIAAVRFWPDENLISSPAGAFSANVNLTSTPKDQLGTVDMSTAIWWMEQKESARAHAFDQTSARPLDIVLAEFYTWLGVDGGCHKFWSDSTFDFRLIRQAFERTKFADFSDKVKYYRALDWRTLRNEGKDRKIDEPMFVGDRHIALNDSFHQAGYAMNILRARKGLPIALPTQAFSTKSMA